MRRNTIEWGKWDVIILTELKQAGFDRVHDGPQVLAKSDRPTADDPAAGVCIIALTKEAQLTCVSPPGGWRFGTRGSAARFRVARTGRTPTHLFLVAGYAHNNPKHTSMTTFYSQH